MKDAYPTALKLGVPEREVPVPEQLPHAILLEVLVLVEPALPPLYVTARVSLVDRVVLICVSSRPWGLK